jgi:hypothetical protein
LRRHSWKTYSEAAVAAGESRIHAGFHIKSGNEDALAAGSEIGEKVWLVCTSLWDPPASSSQGTQKSTNATHFLLTVVCAIVSCLW